MKKNELRHADNHPAILNLRHFLKQYLSNGGTLREFALSMNMTVNQIGFYLRGDYVPRRKKIEEWALLLGVDYDYMMNKEVTYIRYPFQTESAKKKSGSHITKHEVRHKYNQMVEVMSTYVREKEYEDGDEILEILRKIWM